MRHILYLLVLFGSILVLSPIANAATGDLITNVTWPSKSVYCPQESIPFKVTIQNTGSECRTFLVGYSVQDSNGHWWNEPEIADQTASICPGNNSSMKLAWDPLIDVPRGYYTAEIILWEGWNEGVTVGEIDNKIKSNAFQLDPGQTFQGTYNGPTSGYPAWKLQEKKSSCSCK